MAKVKDYGVDGLVRNDAWTDKFGARPKDDKKPLAETTLHTYGNVALLCTYGSDDLIVEAARVSYGKGTQTVRDTKNLIRYLLRHKHTSPFEQAELTFYLRLPIFVVRQLIRHRTANVNEYSARYSELSNDYYVPSAEEIARQSTANRQGRGEKLTVEEAEKVQHLFVDAQETCVRTYRELLDTYGIAREIARVPTSVGMYSEMYWKCDVHNFMHFLKLRLDAHAQQEIRDFATAMYACAQPYFPHVFAAFDDYILNAYTLSALEIKMLRVILSQSNVVRGDWPVNSFEMSAREYSECCHFLDTLVS
jgi:thymidylate synthase (FAD)